MMRPKRPSRSCPFGHTTPIRGHEARTSLPVRSSGCGMVGRSVILSHASESHHTVFSSKDSQHPEFGRDGMLEWTSIAKHLECYSLRATSRFG
jgi:hypothetical protein